jgi:hypothetical protein
MTRKRLARRPPVPAWPTLIALVVVAAATTGCGGGTGGAGSTSNSSTKAVSSQAPTPTKPGSSPATSSTRTGPIGTAPNPPTDASFVAQAEAICAQRNSELTAVGAVGVNKAQLASVAARRAVIERQALAELGKLTPPTDMARDWQGVITYSRLTLARVEKLARDAKSHGATSVERFRTGSASAVRFRLLVAARRAGLKQCAFVL